MKSNTRGNKHENVFNLFIIICISIVSLLTSCNKNNNEPEIIPLTIHRHFKTEILQVELAETDKFSEYRDKVYIVNSPNDIPVDKYFGVETFKESNINFTDFSLIIVYQLLLGEVTTFKYDWRYNNWDSRYQFNFTYDSIKGSEYIDGEIDKFSYIRCAFLVHHIPSDAECTITTGMYGQ